VREEARPAYLRAERGELREAVERVDHVQGEMAEALGSRTDLRALVLGDEPAPAVLTAAAEALAVGGRVCWRSRREGAMPPGMTGVAVPEGASDRSLLDGSLRVAERQPSR
jgi:hypothetical protein